MGRRLQWWSDCWTLKVVNRWLAYNSRVSRPKPESGAANLAYEDFASPSKTCSATFGSGMTEDEILEGFSELEKEDLKAVYAFAAEMARQQFAG